MKKTIAVMLCFASLVANAEKIDASKVPAAVRESFSKSFPAVKDAKWEKEKGDFEANFKEGSQSMSATFDASGHLNETERSIPVANLPANATAYLKSHYAGEKVKEAAELTMPDGTTTYEAEVKGTDLIFDANGGFLKAVKD